MRERHHAGRFEILALVVLGLAVASRDAHAYLDPGTGSYLFQVTAAALFAGLFALKQWWHHVRGRFRTSGGARSAHEACSGCDGNGQ